MDIPNEKRHLIRKHLEAVLYYFHRTLALCNGFLVKQREKRMLETEIFSI